MVKYIGVSLPITLLEKIDEKRKSGSYSSRADFVKESVRRELERLEKLKRRDANE